MGEKCGCEMKGLLSFLLLFIISKKRKICGREISSEVEKRKGCCLSPGTLYPALAGLCATGLINEKKKGRICVYNITKKGRRAFKAAKTRFKKEFYGL